MIKKKILTTTREDSKMMMTSNDLKKGIKVVMTPFRLISNAPRTGVLMDNMKGVTRLVHIEEKNGYLPDMGSVYVDEIVGYQNKEGKWEEVELSVAHAKKMMKIRASLEALF